MLGNNNFAEESKEQLHRERNAIGFGHGYHQELYRQLQASLHIENVHNLMSAEPVKLNAPFVHEESKWDPSQVSPANKMESKGLTSTTYSIYSSTKDYGVPNKIVFPIEYFEESKCTRDLYSFDKNSIDTNNTARFYAPWPPKNPTLTNSPSLKDIEREVYKVSFKNSSGFYYLDDNYGKLEIGQFVKVEADRGEDLGIITEMGRLADLLGHNKQDRKIEAKGNKPKFGRILRLATIAERSQLPEKHLCELEAMEFCKDLAMRVHHLPIAVLSVVFQFDRNKLTIFYSSTCRVDFREFVRDLFGVYKSRIWMEKVLLSNPGASNGLVELALETGQMLLTPARPSKQQHQQQQQQHPKLSSSPTSSSGSSYHQHLGALDFNYSNHNNYHTAHHNNSNNNIKTAGYAFPFDL